MNDNIVMYTGEVLSPYIQRKGGTCQRSPAPPLKNRTSDAHPTSIRHPKYNLEIVPPVFTTWPVDLVFVGQWVVATAFGVILNNVRYVFNDDFMRSHSFISFRCCCCGFFLSVLMMMLVTFLELNQITLSCLIHFWVLPKTQHEVRFVDPSQHTQDRTDGCWQQRDDYMECLHSKKEFSRVKAVVDEHKAQEYEKKHGVRPTTGLAHH
jgi:hypothetical protein